MKFEDIDKLIDKKLLEKKELFNNWKPNSDAITYNKVYLSN